MKNLRLLGITLLSTIIVFVACKKEKVTLPSNELLKVVSGCVDDPVVETANILKRQGATFLVKGQMSVWNTNDAVYVQIDATSSFDNSKLYIGDCSSVPNVVTTNNIDHDPAVTTYTYSFPNTHAPGDEICVSLKISGNRLANLSYIIQEICDCEIQIGDFRTQSKGGWGAPPNGNNNAQYMYDHWDAIGSITTGCGDFMMTLSSAEEVTAYLPNGHNSDAPFNTNLATQIVALSISLALDAYVDDFGASDNSLGCLKVDSGLPEYSLFNGMMVSEVLELANEVLGGCNNDFSMAEMTAIVDALNLNFHDGTIDNGLLTCGDCDE